MKTATSTRTIQRLLEKGANPNLANNAGEKALGFTLKPGNNKSSELLLQAGATLTGTELTAAKFDANAPDDVYDNWLNGAILSGHESLACFLIEHNADIHQRYGINDKDTALNTALGYGKHQVAAALINKGARFDSEHDGEKQALVSACLSGDKTSVELMLNLAMPANTATISDSALSEAAAAGNLEIVQLLVENGVEVNGTGGAQFGDIPLYSACRNNHLAIVNFLIQQGADVSEVSDGNRFPTALSIAAEVYDPNKHIDGDEHAATAFEIIQTLLKHHASLDELTEEQCNIKAIIENMLTPDMSRDARS